MIASKRLLLLALAICTLGAPRPSHAQDQASPGDVIVDSYFSSLLGLFDSIPGGGLDFDFNFDAAIAGGVLSSALVNDLASFPIGSSSGGFTYFFDPASGTAVRSSPSFGPAFAERPLTSGRGHLNLGLTYLRRSFGDIEGVDIGDGSLVFAAPLFFGDTGDSADLIESTFRLDATVDSATFFATYGVLDQLDIALAVPVHRVAVEASVTSQLVRFGPSSQALAIQPFTSTSSSDATGLGDIAIRGKYNLYSGDVAAVAAGVDLRLPTGDEAELLGTGLTRTKIYGAVSSRLAGLFPHANIGYTFESEGGEDSAFFFGSEFSYTVGTEYVAHPRVTIVGDIIGRSLADEGRLEPTTAVFDLVEVIATDRGRRTVVPAEQRTVSQLSFNPGVRLNTVLGAIGAKLSPTSTMIISAHLLFQMTEAGLRSKVTPVIGVDYTF